MHLNVHSSTIYNSQVLEANKVPISKLYSFKTFPMTSKNYFLTIASNEIKPHTSENGPHYQINRQVLERLWRKGNPSTLLVGMQTSASTVENSMEFLQKTKYGTAF